MNKEMLCRRLKILSFLSSIFLTFIFLSCGDKSKNYTLKDYHEYISSLNDDDFFSITSAVDEFQNNFEKKSYQKNDSAFIEFRNYYYKVINTGNVKFWQDEEFQAQFYEDASSYSNQAVEFLDSLHNNGLKLSASEGLFYIDEDPAFLYDKFSMFLSASLKEYLVLRKKELEEGFADDAELLISYEELGSRIIDWENYNEKYPNSLLKEEAEFNYELYLNTFLTGMDNSNIWDENGILTDELKNDYKNYIDKRKEKPSGKLVQKFYAFLESNDFRYSEDVFNFYDENLPDLMFGDHSPIN